MSELPSPPAPIDGHWTEARRELRHWFEREAPGLTEAYVAAVEVAHGRAFEGHPRLVAHALRDLVNRLPDALDGRKEERFEYNPAVEGLMSVWVDAGLPVDVTLEGDGGVVPEPPLQTVPSNVFTRVQGLLREHKGVRGRARGNARRLFAALVPQGGAEGVVSGPLLDRWFQVGKWAAKKVHYAPRATEITREECVRELEVFEGILGGMVRRFFEVTRGLDEILEEANS